MDYRIKAFAGAVAQKINAEACSASVLKAALTAIAEEPDIEGCPAYAGHILEERLIELVRQSIPDESTSDQWREYRLDTDAFKRKICIRNISYGCEIHIEYFDGNIQYLVSAGFITSAGGGREYYCFNFNDPEVETYRIRHTTEKI
jgi:hypothetical protein